MMQKAILILVVALAATSEGRLEPGLRVKFGIDNDPTAGTSYFFELPLNVSAAVAQGWTKVRRPPGHLPQLTMYCSPKYTICILCDDLKNVAGLQVAINKDKISNNVFDWKTRGFTEWKTTVEGRPATLYAQQQYFVSAEYLKKSKKERLRTRDPTRLLQENAVWFNGVGGLRKVSNNEKVIEEEKVFLKQACMNGMGQHWFYNLSKTAPRNAENIYPWFPLTFQGEMYASGFLTTGNLTVETSGARNWLEKPNVAVIEMISPRATSPDWLYEIAVNPGIITLHIFYTNTPWLILC